MNIWSWTTGAVLLLLFLFTAVVYGQERRELRVDTFDTRSNRTGYAIINEKTGRIDTFDTRSRRTGSGTITPPPAAGTGVPSTPRPTTAK